MAEPTAEEQQLLEYINAARMDPLGDAARYISGYGAIATSANADVNAALRFFGVSGPALFQALSALTPVQPLAWNDALSNAAQGHDAAMIAADSQTHQAPGEADLGARFTAAGYNYSFAGENVFAFATSPLEAHAGFMVDWGNGPDGMQSPPGHRDNIMDGDFREIGVALVHETNPATQVGPEVVTEDLGLRSRAGVFILGVAYDDANGDDFYSVGEARSGLHVSVGGAATDNFSTGGYTLQTSLTGVQTITFTGADLAGPITVSTSLFSGENAKFDIVNGAELKSSVSATVGGAVKTLEGMGVIGLALRAVGGDHTILGASGADTVSADAGTNYLRGGSGNDSIVGGTGFDDINGNQGNDTCVSGGGDDWVVGGKDNDSLAGSDGQNLVYGNLGADTCDGGGGNDIVRGGQDNDSLTGGAGDDFVSGDKGDDTVMGGAGADLFHTFGDAGIDRVLDFHVSEGDRVMLDPGTQYAVAQVGADTVISMTGGAQMVLVGVAMASLPGGWIFGA